MEFNIFDTQFNAEPADVPHVLQLEIIQLNSNNELKALYNNMPLLNSTKVTYARMNFKL